MRIVKAFCDVIVRVWNFIVRFRVATSHRMEASWFKQKQKQAGLTSFDLGKILQRDRSVISKIINGGQKMTLEQAKLLAEALDVPLSEMLERSGLADAPTAQQFAPGFAESDASPFVAQSTSPGKFALIGEMFGARPGVDVWLVRTRSMELGGYLPGDFILVDTHQAERSKAGDVVIAQVYSRTGARTVLRRFMPPVLIAATAPSSDEPVYVVDNDMVSIRGRVTASWRLPATNL
ncbi:MAG: XRE family transcriptional regulator [Pseudomonadota bacterium]